MFIEIDCFVYIHLYGTMSMVTQNGQIRVINDCQSVYVYRL